ncbi:TatD family hydrolase [Mycoplasma enhydrae]|uniref:TatD family hydrolase n=1 Tax=Mycoplasma enhydrae TaxID=2499220 RepID=UPI00197C1387|nr:TatD family hydrolase [Mycoplasma enhydrae]MBN4089327.1 TatD family hydrolase [Mycoplasma enhydrae]MCV3733699.1 TatD family hydrolase [Mycoplasma enhydrae]MCV3753644.1 TatD family hydrolase [Mycoplasma enhydrae]
MKYIDIHTHPFKEYYENPHDVVKSWHQDNMELMFVNGTSKEDSAELLELCAKEKYLYPIIGIHPTLSEGSNDGKYLESIITNDVIGIGEIGLDYHYDDSPSKEIQKEGFISQIEVAQKHNIVVVMHIRDALEDAYDIISKPEYKNTKFVFHSFSGNKEFAKKCIKHDNFYFSFSGVVTFKNAKDLQEACLEVPIDRIFCETDTPYLAPTPMRGKPNISPYVEYVYRFIANLKGIEESVLVEQVRQNVKKVFGV